MLLFMRYLPILALVIGLAVGYKIRDAGADRALAALRAEFAAYQLRAANAQAQASRDAQARLSAQADKIEEAEYAKLERDSRISSLERDLRATAARVRLRACPASSDREPVPAASAPHQPKR